MAETTTVARPYAKGVFQLANERKALPHWSEQLDLAAAVVADQQMSLVLGSPRLNAEQKADLILDVCGEGLDAEGRNFVRLLIDNRRIMLLPEIAAQYRAMRAEAERTVEATLVTAQPVEEAVRERVESALSKRLDRKVTLATEVDEDLIGGAIVRAGDQVIDGSVRGRLTRLAGAMSR